MKIQFAFHVSSSNMYSVENNAKTFMCPALQFHCNCIGWILISSVLYVFSINVATNTFSRFQVFLTIFRLENTRRIRNLAFHHLGKDHRHAFFLVKTLDSQSTLSI